MSVNPLFDPFGIGPRQTYGKVMCIADNPLLFGKTALWKGDRAQRDPGFMISVQFDDLKLPEFFTHNWVWLDAGDYVFIG